LVRPEKSRQFLW